MGRAAPAEGTRVEIQTPDGVETGVVDLVIPPQMAVNIDEEFWVLRNGPLGEIPTNCRRLIHIDSDWKEIP